MRAGLVTCQVPEIRLGEFAQHSHCQCRKLNSFSLLLIYFDGGGVADIKNAIAVQRAEQEASGKQFDPVFWLGDLLTRSAATATGAARQNRSDLSDAWDVISQPFVKSPDYRQAIDATLLTSTAMRRSNTVTLTPPAAKLMRAMADAAGVPYDPKQTTIDLLPTPQRKELFRNVYTKIAHETSI
jgi:hypothetical protein